MSGTFGLDAGTADDSVSSGYLTGSRFQNTVGTGTLTKLELFFNDVTPSGNVKLLVYADNAGAPAALLLNAGPVVVADGWVEISGLSLAVTLNTYYWLTYISDDTSTGRLAVAAANSYAYVADSYVSPTDPFPSPTYVAYQKVMRATVTTGAGDTIKMIWTR